MALIQVNYLSKALFRNVPVNVILPVDNLSAETNQYKNNVNGGYKTLYLLHGLLGDCTDWVTRTRIRQWAEEKNLAVVMPSGDNSFYFKSRTPWNDYETFIGSELVEITRKMFPLSNKREDTFIAGLSMGGYGALRNGMVFFETFGCVAGLSSPMHIFDDTSDKADIGLFDDFKAAAKTNLNPWIAVEEMLREKRSAPRFYLACGTKDGFYKRNKDFRDFLISKGLDVTWSEGSFAHEWDYWDLEIKKVLSWLPL